MKIGGAFTGGTAAKGQGFYERAQARRVPGRSNMDKAALIVVGTVIFNDAGTRGVGMLAHFRVAARGA